jgi:3D (Asp-Asp-Asp) domain-containing protein
VLVQQLSATRQTLRTSQRVLAVHLRALYEQGNVDPLAVMLGATSLDAAMTRLDDLTRVADQSRKVVQVTTTAGARLVKLRRALALRRARLRVTTASAARAADELASAREQRLGFIAGLRAAAQLKSQQIAGLEAAARRAQQRAASLQAAAATPVPVPPAATRGQAPPLAGARTITVVATGYSLTGRTSTGVPVGWGVVAVDPSVIPLGTRLTIPGYGSGVAADTGVSGAAIDLWFSTPAQAHAWGRRAVTVTLH